MKFLFEVALLALVAVLFAGACRWLFPKKGRDKKKK